MERKLIRNGNGWALCLNSTMLECLNVNPEIDLVKYIILKDKILLEKGSKILEKQT